MRASMLSLYSENVLEGIIFVARKDMQFVCTFFYVYLCRLYFWVSGAAKKCAAIIDILYNFLCSALREYY